MQSAWRSIQHLRNASNDSSFAHVRSMEPLLKFHMRMDASLAAVTRRRSFLSKDSAVTWRRGPHACIGAGVHERGRAGCLLAHLLDRVLCMCSRLAGSPLHAQAAGPPTLLLPCALLNRPSLEPSCRVGGGRGECIRQCHVVQLALVDTDERGASHVQ